MMQGRIVAALAGVLLALGSARAQAPQACPTLSATNPLPPPSSPWGGPGAYGYSAPASVSPPGSTFSVTKEGGALRLLVVGNDGLRSSCEKTMLLIAGAAPVTIRVDGAGKQLLVHNDADVKGTADRVSRGGTDGATLTLEGNAQLTCCRNGRRVEMSGERLAVNLLTGHVEAELGAPQPATPAPTGPITPVTTGISY